LARFGHPAHPFSETIDQHLEDTMLAQANAPANAPAHAPKPIVSMLLAVIMIGGLAAVSTYAIVLPPAHTVTAKIHGAGGPNP
jgi:hypothetical protein